MEGPQAHKDLEPVQTRAYGEGWLAPATPDQPRDLILFDRKSPPRDEKGRPVFGCTVGEEVPVCASKKGGKDGHCAREQREINGRCKFHGGRSPKGAASPHYRGKGRSRYQIAGHLVERFERLLEDPELHHHRKSIAAIDAIIDELWMHYLSGWDHDLARKALATFNAMEAARAANNRLRALELLETLGQQLDSMVSGGNQSEKIVRYLGERRRHADSESRRKLAESMVFTLEEAYEFYTTLGTAVTKHVRDPEVKRALLHELATIAGQSPSAAS